MSKAERAMLKLAYPKTDLEKTTLIVLPPNSPGILSIEVLDRGSKPVKLRKFMLVGKHRIWSMRIGRNSRKEGGRDRIVYGRFCGSQKVSDGRDGKDA